MLNLADYGRIRVMADRLGVETIDREGRVVVLKFRPQAKVDPVRLVALVRQRPELTLVPPAALRLDLRWDSGFGSRASGGIGRPDRAPVPNPEARSPDERRQAPIAGGRRGRARAR